MGNSASKLNCRGHADKAYDSRHPIPHPSQLHAVRRHADNESDSLCLMRRSFAPPRVRLELINNECTRVISHAESEPNDLKTCTICLDDIPDPVFEGFCGHSFCHECMKRLIIGATNNEQLYPARCCDNIVPITVAKRVLTYSEYRYFIKKANEWETKTKDRIYCANRPCSEFIPSSHIKDQVGLCKKCNKETHLPCRSLAHPGIDCPMDSELEKVLEIAESQKWKRCPVCRTMVERVQGCNHITCA